MEIASHCAECEAIALELAEAYVGMWDAASPQSRRTWSAVHKIIGGTEGRRTEGGGDDPAGATAPSPADGQSARGEKVD